MGRLYFIDGANEKPKNCRECKWGQDSGLGSDMVICLIERGIVGVNKRGEHSNCPLKELPVPHGRLVDVDEGLKYCTDPHEIAYWDKEVPVVIDAED